MALLLAPALGGLLQIPEHDSSKASVLGFEVYLRAGSVKRPHAALLLGPALDGLLQLP